MHEIESYIQSCTAGYTCGLCGQWIPYGQIHYCYNWPTQYWYYPTYQDEKLYKLLEEIRDALKELKK